MKWDSTIKREEKTTDTCYNMNETKTLCQVKEAHKRSYNMISFIWYMWKSQSYRDRKQMSRYQGLGWRVRTGSDCNEYIIVGSDTNILKKDLMIVRQLNLLKGTEMYTQHK